MASYSNFKVIREYLRDDSFLSRPEIFQGMTEYQLCLAFARDSDHSNRGEFTPGWDTANVTPQLIQGFKAKCADSSLPVKVLLSIGGDDPFVVGGITDADQWIPNAIASLNSIIKEYHLDGIDVSYTTIECNTDLFVMCIKKLFTGLKDMTVANRIFVASIATTVSTDDEFYFPLFQAAAREIETVVIQCHVDMRPTHWKPLKSLVRKTEGIAEQYGDPVYELKNILLGYSAIKEDWSRVSPPWVFLALYVMVQNLKVKGSSIKIISDTLASFPPKWIAEVLSSAAVSPP